MGVIGTGQQTLTDMNDVIAQATQPSNPIDGTLWWNTTELKLYVYATATGWKFAGDGMIIGGRNLLINSSLEKTGANEFLAYADIAPIIDKYGLVQYAISFDIKSPVAGNVNVYCQNGSDAKYSIGTTGIDVTSTYTRKYIIVTPTNQNAVTQSQLSFYGTYGTGRIPTVKNVKVELGNISTDYTQAPEDVQTQIDTVNTTLGNMANDSLIDYTERQIVKDDLTDIIGLVQPDATTTLPTTATLDSGLKGSFYLSRKSATNAGVLTTDTTYINLVTQYNALKTYLEGLTPIDVWDVSTANQSANISVTKSTWRTNWLNYYQAEKDLDAVTALKLKQNVDNTQFGGRNLLANTDFKLDISGWVGAGNHTASLDTTPADKYNNNNVLQIVSTGVGSSANNISASVINGIKNGQSYIVSFYAKSVSGNTSLHNEIWGGVGATNFTLTTSWQKFTTKLTGSTTNQSFYLWLAGTGTALVTLIKLEEGNTNPTDWTPAPEDVASKKSIIFDINNSTEAITINATKINITGAVTFNSLDSATQTKVTNGDSANTTVTAWKQTGKTTINGGQIETDTVTATQINVTNLSSLSSDLGTVTAGSITGATLNLASGKLVVDGSGNVTVNGNITMTSGSINWASISKPSYTAGEVGARPSSWTPSSSEVGAISNTYIDANGVWTGYLNANTITAGTVSADRISGGTLTGTKWQSASDASPFEIYIGTSSRYKTFTVYNGAIHLYNTDVSTGVSTEIFRADTNGLMINGTTFNGLAKFG